MGDANPLAPHRDHGTIFQSLSMVKDDLREKIDTLLCGDIRKAQEAGVRNLIEVDELAKVGVNGHQNPALGLREFQQGPVPGILAELASFKDIMPLVQ